MRPTTKLGAAAAAAAVATLAAALALSTAAHPPAVHTTCASTAPAHATMALTSIVAAGKRAHKRPHLPPLWPLTPRSLATLLLASAAVALAAGGGMGGGGILVPLFLLVLRAPTRDAVALSNVTILGGALAAAAVNVPRRHPTLNRPLIDWDVMLLMEPTTIVGAVAGGYLNRVSPSWATTTALALLLTAITAQLTLRATGLWREETRAAREGGAALLSGDGADRNSGDPETVVPPPVDPHAEPRVIPTGKALTLVALNLLVVASDEVKTRATRCGSVGYWLAVCAVIPAAVAVAAVTRARILRQAEAGGGAAARPASGPPSPDAPLHWSRRTATLCPALATLAGLIAGTFGVGGGIVKGPILLELGVAPAVAAATSAGMIAFTSAAAAAVYISFGTVRADYGAALFVVGATCTTVGLRTVSRAVTRLGRRSIIVVTMAALLGVSAGAAAYEAGVLTLDVARRGAWGERGSVC